jgi:hypothetical protein
MKQEEFMQKLSVIYHAPPGDSKVLEMHGHTFFDGKAEDIEVSDEVAEKIKKNPVFAPGGKAEHGKKELDDDEHGKKHR